MSYWTKECLEIANFKAQSRACCFVPNHTHMATSVLSFVVPTEGFTQISKKKRRFHPYDIILSPHLLRCLIHYLHLHRVKK